MCDWYRVLASHDRGVLACVIGIGYWPAMIMVRWHAGKHIINMHLTMLASMLVYARKLLKYWKFSQRFGQSFFYFLST